MPRAAVIQTKSVCPHCRDAIQPTSELVVCQMCLSQHHSNCWEAAGGCSVYGCGSRSSMGARVMAPARQTPSTAQTSTRPVSMEQAPTRGETDRLARSQERRAKPRMAAQPKRGSSSAVLWLAFIMAAAVGFGVFFSQLKPKFNKSPRPRRVEPTRRTTHPRPTIPTPSIPVPPVPPPRIDEPPTQGGGSSSGGAPQDSPGPGPGPGRDPLQGPQMAPRSLMPLQFGPEVAYQVSSRIRRYERQLRQCSRRWYSSKPLKLTAIIIVSPPGRVTSVTIVGATPDAAHISACVERTLRRIRFPRFRLPTQSVLLPLEFR